MLRLFSSKAQLRKIFQNHLNPVMLVLIGKFSDEYPYARVSVIFQVFLYNFVLAKLATSSIRVKGCLRVFNNVNFNASCYSLILYILFVAFEYEFSNICIFCCSVVV